ncbi:hypothetical protein [Spiroplasma culicicola]|uniref:Uncharacterized protein n=1 Tax=Spiroplasma culicicola AES-1 TaxID=1276246 RepID=W6A848_9MOLU|nr:hypothetical protein [Spiroplasma culicicola]AHI53156.1 hypothetical protein SCULI_v1c08160 [Spiroplasma culicicola AES-1]
MLYEKEQFWTDFYIDYINTMVLFKKINISSDEIADFVEEKDYLDEDAKNTYEDILINTAKALDLVRALVTKGVNKKETEDKLINIEDLKNIYLAFDPSGQKLDVFEFKTEKSKKFYEILEYIWVRMYSYDDLCTLCEYLLYAYVDYLKLMPLDELSLDYIWFLIQAMFIFKGFGPVLFIEEYEFWELFEVIEKLKNDTENLDYTEWPKLFNFKRVAKSWEESSSLWVEAHAFKYK